MRGVVKGARGLTRASGLESAVWRREASRVMVFGVGSRGLGGLRGRDGAGWDVGTEFMVLASPSFIPFHCSTYCRYAGEKITKHSNKCRERVLFHR